MGVALSISSLSVSACLIGAPSVAVQPNREPCEKYTGRINRRQVERLEEAIEETVAAPLFGVYPWFVIFADEEAFDFSLDLRERIKRPGDAD